MMKGMTLSLQEQFGQIDIYVFDQILRGNIAPGMRVLDAGCGYGRNLVYLLRAGCEVFGLDRDGQGVEHVRQLATSLGDRIPAENFQVGAIERMSFPDRFADVVICSAVLHFARDEDHFRGMVMELWRVLRPGGMLFCRLASRIGMEFERALSGLFVVGDGSEWFLVDEEMLMELTEEMNGALVDPLKTTIVQHRRCMTTWVLRKRH
jgi:SAM-dependent methyltransferase